jgi:adenosylcobinamide-phosphate synthase
MQKVIVILLAISIDLIFGDPPNRFHPVVLMGNFLSLGRRRAPERHRFWFGAGWIVAGVALFASGIKVLSSEFRVQSSKGSKVAGLQGSKKTHITHHTSRITLYVLRFTLLATSLKLMLSYRNLRRAVNDVAAALRVDNLPEARRLLSWHLVSRDTSQLTAEEVAGAAIESLTENITDGLTSPLLAYAVGGLPAAWGYRLVNTADAMWGYRNEEFEQLGKFPARLDDVLNWLPARLAGWLIVTSAWLVGENSRQAANTMLNQHSRTASPNAGWTMAAAAGALEVTLTKQDTYQLEGGQNNIGVTTIYRALQLTDVTVALFVWLVGTTLYILRR